MPLVAVARSNATAHDADWHSLASLSQGPGRVVINPSR
jgi:hypothetical protein